MSLLLLNSLCVFLWSIIKTAFTAFMMQLRPGGNKPTEINAHTYTCIDPRVLVRFIGFLWPWTFSMASRSFEKWGHAKARRFESRTEAEVICTGVHCGLQIRSCWEAELFDSVSTAAVPPFLSTDRATNRRHTQANEKFTRCLNCLREKSFRFWGSENALGTLWEFHENVPWV